MTIPVWPAWLPYASSYAGFSVEQAASPALRTEMNAGTSLQRRTSTLRITVMKVAIEMTGAQEGDFDAFHAALGDGAARFNMPVWNGSAYVSRNVQIDEGKVSKTQLGPSIKSIAFTIRVEAL